MKEITVTVTKADWEEGTANRSSMLPISQSCPVAVAVQRAIGRRFMGPEGCGTTILELDGKVFDMPAALATIVKAFDSKRPFPGETTTLVTL